MFRYVLILFILIFSCKKDDGINSNQNVDNTDDMVNLVNCPNVDYPSWLESPYVLPYSVSTSYLVKVSNCSGDHSEGSSIQFAYDFEMEIGTLVTSTREGEVVQVIDSAPDFGAVDNVVVVRHEDNTFAHYKHLTQNGALVQSGDLVEQGDAIGLSGATGEVEFSHLHFMVTQGNFSTSIPTTFFNTESHPNGLLEGAFYVAEAY